MNIEIGNKKIDFVYQGDNLIYPNYPARENLILHYDFSGMKNSDVTKDIARDLSGNGNNGVLQNFAYIDESGYLDNALIFDGIDDFITIPEPQIDLDNFTYSEGINVLSFRGDEVATVVDGVVEIGGRNLIVLQNVVDKNGRLIQPKNTTIYIYSDAGFYTTDKIYVNEGDKVVLTSHRVIGGYLALGYFDEDDIYFSRPVMVTNFEANSYVLTIPSGVAYVRVSFLGSESNYIKLEKGNKATDWTPAPEDLETTTFKPFFNKKIKSALYWNRALTDEELLQVYNTQIKRT